MSIWETIKQSAGSVTIVDFIYLAGILLFSGWLLKTSFGRKALAGSVPRRNKMPVYMPLIPLFIWFGAVSIAITFTELALPDLADWKAALLKNVILSAGAIIGMAVILFLARASFARRLKGFGLDTKTIVKDFGVALLNLLSAWPVVTLMLIVTIIFGELIWGQDFQMQQHEELESITAHPQLSLRVLIVVTAVLIVPAFEEMLFRGLFQTMIRSFVKGPWRAIFLSSALFALVHANVQHWAALFTLSVCLGYSYEKTGSLFRPIFIHSLFNAMAITAALNQ